MTLLEFFNLPIFTIIGGFSSVVVIIGFLYTICLIVTGVTPVLYRLGKGLSQRKITILASGKFDEIKNILVDSGIIKKKNVIKIGINEIPKVESYSIMIVHWNDYKDKLEDILNYKRFSDVLIVYAPQSEGFIEKDKMERLSELSNCIIVNFKGRLLNDTISSIISTKDGKK